MFDRDIICMVFQKYEEGKSVSFQDEDETLTQWLPVLRESSVTQEGRGGRTTIRSSDRQDDSPSFDSQEQARAPQD